MFLCPLSAASLLPHRFVTVRRGSPAAKSGQIRAGDRLEAVEGRSVVTLPHRELAQILRRAGNTLRLTIVPRPSTCKSAPPNSPNALRLSPPSTDVFLPQTRPACPNPSMTPLTEAEKVKGYVQRSGCRGDPCKCVLDSSPVLTVHLSPSVTPGTTAWTWNVGRRVLASASEGAASTTWACTSWD